MQAAFRKFLSNTLGLRRYLSLVSKAFIILMLAGFFKKKYPEYHFLKKFVQPGWYCIDIGANLGYFSIVMSKAVGKEGKVLAVEPVKLFNRIFRSNVELFTNGNVKLMPYALGAEEKMVTMGTPVKEGVFRHGLTKVVDNEEQNYKHTYWVEMKVPDKLFGNLKRLDFIKCDVEGYETEIFPYFLKVLEKYQPVLQIEINNEESREQIFGMIKHIGYKPYGLMNGNLKKLDNPEMKTWDESDLFFQVENQL